MTVSLCNELFHHAMPLEELAARCREIGVRGIELAPDTVFATARHPSQREMERLRGIFRDSGVRFTGFHWLLRHDPALRLIADRKPAESPAWQTILRLSDAAAEIGGGVLVLGSGKQRSHTAGVSQDDALRYLRDGVAYVARLLASSVVLGVEPLPPSRTNTLNSIEDAYRFVTEVEHPQVGLVFDLRSAGRQSRAGWDSITAVSDLLRHVHLQDRDGSLPRPESEGMKETLQRLSDCSYSGWTSIEPFTIDSDVAVALVRIRQLVTWMSMEFDLTSGFN